MVTLTMLWLPILVSAVLVHIASTIFWMLAPHHKNDWRGFTNEPALTDALRASGAVPGQYMVPWHGNAGGMKSPEFAERLEKGPNAFITVGPSGPVAMGPNIAFTFLTFLLVSLVLGFIAHCALTLDAEPRRIWCVIGAAAGLAHTTGAIPNAIWFQTPRSTMAKNVFDGIVYAVITAAVFVWLWPG